MEFQLIHESKLKVLLSAEDMEENALEYSRMDYQDKDTRRALVRILEAGRQKTGFDPKKAKLFIEAYPCEGGGCVLFFTCLQGGADKTKAAMVPFLFEFDDVDCLVDCACKACSLYRHRIYKSSLYQMRDRYFLVVYPLDYSDRLSVYFLSEFGRRAGEGELLAAYLEEHGRELMRDQAIDLLAEYFADRGSR